MARTLVEIMSTQDPRAPHITCCIAHSAIVTGYWGEPREFAHCGVCTCRFEQEYAADPMPPRHKDGRLYRPGSKAARSHREYLGRLLVDGIARSVAPTLFGMTIDEAAREYPYGVMELRRPSCAVQYLAQSSRTF